MNIHKNPGNSQSWFVISALVWRHSQVHPKFSLADQRAPRLITITPIVLLYQSSEIPVTPVLLIRDPSYSQGLPEYPPRIWYSPEIDASKFTLHILSDTPGVFQRLQYILLMKMGLGKTFTSVAAAMICKLLTEKVVMGLPLSILWGNTLDEWVDMVQNGFPGIIGEERAWYPLRRHNSVPRRLIEIQKTPPQGHPVLTSAVEPILVFVPREWMKWNSNVVWLDLWYLTQG